MNTYRSLARPSHKKLETQEERYFKVDG